MRELINDIIGWGYDKGIQCTHYKEYELQDVRIAQLMKTREEVDELYQAIVDKNSVEVQDAIGDIIVTLIMQAELWDCDIEDCLNMAYYTISKRTGKMVDGQFVKDE